jgi:uncharacterized protein DUF4259/immunity protein 26 of polymorphic toxin system
MGAWGVRAFDNDTANDWGSGLQGVDDLSLVESAFSDLESSNPQNTREPIACRALAACEVLARLLGNPGYNNSYTRKMDRWAADHPLIPPPDLLLRAESAIQLILGEGSELCQLWGGSEEWREAVEDLRRRMRFQQGAAKTPSELRQPPKKRPRTKEGDVFVFDVDADRLAVGQVMWKNVATFPLYVVFFKPLWPREAALSLPEVASSEILLVGATMDARIYHGMWRIVGNIKPDIGRVPMPFFKVYVGGRDIVEDFLGRKMRDATADDLRHYHNRTSRSPMIYEKAIRAYHLDGRLPEYALTLAHAVDQSRATP